MPIAFDAQSRTFHLRNAQVSYLMRVLENGTLGHLYFGGALSAEGSYGHLVAREFLGFDNRLGEPVPLEYPTAGIGDYRVPALVGPAARRGHRPRPALREPPHVPGQARHPGPALDLRRRPTRKRRRSRSC